MSSDVKAATVAATGTVKSGRARIRGLFVVSSAIAGNLTFRDGGAGGTTVLDLDTPAAIGGHPIDIPDRGILCGTDIHATLDANVVSVTVFYEG